MARILPFAAVRFDPTVVGRDLGPVISPPYDVVSGSAGALLAARHPYNAVRLELTVPASADRDRNAHREAARLWASWQASGVLVRDRRPALYLCEHEFMHDGLRMTRTAVVGALGLDPPGEPQPTGEITPACAQGVHAHEHIMPRPKQDRLELLRACHAQFSPILALYRDPQAQVVGALRSALGPDHGPSFEAHADHEALRVWSVAEPDGIERLQSLLAAEPVVVADGHHRLASACRFASETQAPSHRRVLTALVSTTDPAIVVLPTCRVVCGAGPAFSGNLAALVRGSFTCTDIPGYAAGAQAANVEARLRAVERLAVSSGDSTTIAAVTRDATWVLTYAGETAEAVRRLDGLLEQAGIVGSGEQGEASLHAEYTQDTRQAIADVLGGAADAAFIPPAIPATDVFDRAIAGRLFPRKTTYFHPKAPAGLLMLDLDA